MKQYELYILDLDGTVYRGNEPVRHARSTVERLRERGALIRFVTNNSAKTCAEIANKLTNLGIQSEPNDVVTSAVGAADYLVEFGHKRAFVVGEAGLVQTLLERGITVVTAGEADVVVAGICRDLSYSVINEAMKHILGGAAFVATNTDRTYPLEGGQVEPGAGATIGAINGCTGKKPIVIGKPNPYLIQSILTSTGIAPQNAIVVGDRHETDIAAGVAAGCDTLLVLSGVTREPPEGQRCAMDLSALLD